MSNALPLPLQTLLAAAATSRPAVQDIGALSPQMTTLCGVGICVFLVWLARSVNNPTKIKLSVTPGRPNNLTPVHIIVIFLLWFLTPSVVIGIGVQIKLGSSQMNIMAGIAASLVAIFGGLVMAAYSFDGGAVRGMGFTPRRWINDSIRGVIGLMAILPICMGLLVAATLLIMQWRPDLLVTHPLLKILTDPKIPAFWRAMVIPTAVVLAPLGEEVLFRGLLQSMFRRYLRRPWVAILLTSILFSAMHFADIKALPALFALSLALGYSYERTGRLYSPIMIHMLFNLVNIAEALTNTAV